RSSDLPLPNAGAGAPMAGDRARVRTGGKRKPPAGVDHGRPHGDCGERHRLGLVGQARHLASREASPYGTAKGSDPRPACCRAASPAGSGALARAREAAGRLAYSHVALKRKCGRTWSGDSVWTRTPYSTNSSRKRLVRARGLEPPRVAPLAPQASASTSSATTACGLGDAGP